jgi:hypothetical protein
MNMGRNVRARCGGGRRLEHGQNMVCFVLGLKHGWNTAGTRRVTTVLQVSCEDVFLKTAGTRTEHGVFRPWTKTRLEHGWNTPCYNSVASVL